MISAPIIDLMIFWYACGWTALAIWRRWYPIDPMWKWQLWLIVHGCCSLMAIGIVAAKERIWPHKPFQFPEVES